MNCSSSSRCLRWPEYHESKHHPSFWEKLGRTALLTTVPGAAVFQAMAVVDHFWGDFDRLAAQAFEERKELMKLLAAAFDNPGKGFDSFMAAQKANYEKFMEYVNSQTLVGNFRAGMLFGELLFNVLLIIDGVTALAKLASKTPALLRLVPKLDELGPALRRGVEQASRVVKKGGRAPKPVVRPRTADRASPARVSGDSAHQPKQMDAQRAKTEGVEYGGGAGRRAGKKNARKSTLPRDESGNYLPDPQARGAHTVLGKRKGQNGETYTQGATFDDAGNFTGRTDVTSHPPRTDHPNPHFHPATSPNSTGNYEPIK
jgi:hypothetical protein